MSEDPTVKMYYTLEGYRAKAQECETRFGGGTITMLAKDFQDIFNYVRQLQNDALVQMEDKEYEREQKWGAERRAGDAELDRNMLQRCVDWYRWMLDAQEEHDHERDRILHSTVTAWEALPGGQRHSPRAVEKWLVDDMGPAIDTIRRFLSTGPA